MKNELFNRPKGTDGKSVLGSDNVTPLNELEKNALGNLDEDKLNELAKSLFTLNNKRYGPIPGAYMVMCTKPGKQWCVAQLNADRAKPFVIFEDKVFLQLEKHRKKQKELKKSEVNQRQGVVPKLKGIKCPKNLFGYLFLYCCMPLIVFSGA